MTKSACFASNVDASDHFFFQAEDGIRDHCVTGVQTCALPIYRRAAPREADGGAGARLGAVLRHREPVRRRARAGGQAGACAGAGTTGRKSTRLNSSHTETPYAGLCLKKKTTKKVDSKTHTKSR